MKSTPEMRARIRELMTYPHDDYDRAVECVLNDFEVLEPMFDRAVTRGLEQVERIATLEAALREIIQTLESLNDTKRASFYRGSVVNELTVSLDIARSALAPEQDK